MIDYRRLVSTSGFTDVHFFDGCIGSYGPSVFTPLRVDFVRVDFFFARNFVAIPCF